MFLTMLATLERNSLLKPDSEIKNLGRMLALWPRLAEYPSSVSKDLNESETAGTRRFGSIILACVTKYNILLPNKKIVAPKAKRSNFLRLNLIRITLGIGKRH